MREEWRAVKGYDDYEVSNLGRVRSYRNRWGRREEPILLSPGKDSDYRYVTLCNEKGNRYADVHRLVLEAFVGPCPDGMESRHLDGDGSNNDVRNLCWGTRSENELDMVGHGTHPTAVEVSAKIITEIQERHAKGESVRFIASAVGLGNWVVDKVVKGEHWSQR